MKRTPLKRGQPLKRGTKPLKRRAKLTARKVPRAFRQRRDPQYAAYVSTLPCILAGAPLAYALSVADQAIGLAWRGVIHGCWGPVDPAHIGKHRATGAPDQGVLLPLCRATHQFYDEHRQSFYRVTGFGPVELAERAAELWAAYQRETGAP